MRPLRIWRASELRKCGIGAWLVRSARTSGGAARGGVVTAPVRASAKLDISRAPSGMEALAEGWRS